MQRGVVLLVGLLSLSKVFAVNYVFDEFLFSKDTWGSWKLDSPLEEFNPSDLVPRATEDYPGVQGSEFSSIDGPRKRLASNKKPASFSLATDVDALDDDNMVEHAAKAAQCMTCHVLATVVWSRLTGDVLGGDDVSQDVVMSHLQEACEKDVLDAMLKKYTILKMESEGGIASLTFVVVRERRDGGKGAAPTDVEEAAVALSCKNLVEDSGKDLSTELLSQLVNYRREAVRLLAKHDRDGGNVQDEPLAATSSTGTSPGSGSVAGSSSSNSQGGRKGSGRSGKLPRLEGGVGGDDDDDDYLDPDELDEGGAPRRQDTAGGGAAAEVSPPAAGSAGSTGRLVRGLVLKVRDGESACADLDPRCSDWAKNGECIRNPNYMVGTAAHQGHCRKACGVCQPDDVLAASPELSADLEKLSAALLLGVKNLGCGASGACLTGVGGTAVSTGLIKQREQQTGKHELPPGLKQFPGGFVLGKPWWAVPDVRLLAPEQQRKPQASSGTAQPSASGSALEAEAPPGDPSSSSSPSAPSSPPSHVEVDDVLSAALANHVLSIPSDFFIYEYLYKNHTRHFHPEPDGTVTEDWLLGKFTRESVSLMSSATGEVAGLEELDLLPGGPHAVTLNANTWPYVKQVYAGGDECVLAGGRRVVRRVEARIACSPDSGMYMLIREPDFCTYVFVIYVPQLCSLDYYKPRPRMAPKARSGAAVAGGGGGGGGGAAGRRARNAGAGGEL